MELPENLKKRKERVYSVLTDPNCSSQDEVKLYDKWSEFYEKVKMLHVDLLSASLFTSFYCRHIEGYYYDVFVLLPVLQKYL